MLPEELDVVLETSPLGRARATAEIIAVELGIADRNIRSSPLLMEHALGAWEGLTYVEIDDRFPGARQAREADKWHHVIAGGESYALASERAKRWLAGCAAALTVAVTHEMMSRAIQGAYASLSPAETLARSHPQDRLYRLDGGEITEAVIILSPPTAW
jgi:broad specificity phosphatase PhoE